MQTSFIKKAIKKYNKRNLIIASSVLVVIAISYALSLRYYYNFLFGPFNMNTTQVVNSSNSNEFYKYYISYSAENVYDTGYVKTQVSNTGLEIPLNYYYLIPISDKLLLVESPNVINSLEIVGSLKNIPYEIHYGVIKPIVEELPGIENSILPFMIKTSNFRLGGWGWLITSFCLGVTSTFMIVKTLIRIGNPRTHPIMKSITKFGNPEVIINEIDSEILDSNIDGKKLITTQNWFIKPGIFKFKIIHLDDVIWIYKHKVQHRTYGINTFTDYFSIIRDKNGQLISYKSNEEEIDSFLLSIVQKVPWIFFGHSYSLLKMYKNQRTKMIALVEERKSKLMNQEIKQNLV